MNGSDTPSLEQEMLKNPRDYALNVACHHASTMDMLTACLKYMRTDDVIDMLRANDFV
jgi:hypothetical protein